MKSCLQWIGLGFGLAAGGALGYAVITDQATRTAVVTLLVFVLGGIVVGSFVVLAIFAHARALSAGRQQTTVNYPTGLPASGQAAQLPYYEFPPASTMGALGLPAPQQRNWANLPRETLDQDTDQFVA